MIRVSGSQKKNLLLKLINHKQCTNKICSYAKDPFEIKYRFLINKRVGGA